MVQARGLAWDGLRVLDMFAGSGSLGLECLSRGASEAWFVEKSGKAASLIQRNLKELGVGKDRAKVLRKDLFSVLSGRPDQPFGLFLVDPPYGRDLLLPALEKALENGWLAPGGFVLAELESSASVPGKGTALESLECVTDREYGQTRIVIWRN